ncbi:MAG: hypothetical protein ACOC33_00465 [bacterium]
MENSDFNKDIDNDYKQLEYVNDLKKEITKENILNLKDEIDDILNNPKTYEKPYIEEDKWEVYNEFIAEKESKIKKEKKVGFFYKILNYL